MAPSINVDPSNHRIVWIYTREDYERTLANQLENALSELKGDPFVFLLDLRSLRYLLPLDKIMILHIIDKIQAHNLIDLVYLVHSLHYTRMNTILSVNQFPYKDMVFKYEANAKEYLDTMVSKYHKGVSLLS
ncbi:MAG TPA: hypothetical protein VJ824_07260 [Bacillota bacterium]|nr:hypothetical protein [Bacillota bacterium]